MKLKDPKTSLAHILYELIMQGKKGITERDFYYNGFRQRLSEIRNKHLISIKSEKQQFVNTFGHIGHFNRHKLATNKSDAIKIYNELNK
jgi:hypothetical protein